MSGEDLQARDTCVDMRSFVLFCPTSSISMSSSLSVVSLAQWRLHHRFVFSRLVPLGVVLGVCWKPLGTQAQRLGSLGGLLGASFGSLGLLWGPVGPPGTLCRSQGSSLGGPGRPCCLLDRYGGGLRENPGNSKTHFEVILGSFFMIFRYIFGYCFFIDF